MGHTWRLDGAPGRWLEVNLGSGATRTHHLDRDQIAARIGGKTLATDIITRYDTTDWDDALGRAHPVLDLPDVAAHPTSPFTLFTGPYQSTSLGSTGRAVVTTRSPLTQLYLDTYIGGDLGHVLRRAGWDGLFIHGAAERWMRLDIRDDVIDLLPADDLVGLTTWQTEQRLAAQADALPGQEVVSIGPAGEAGSRIASPITSGRRAAGRGGSGAVLGHKRLKAITVSGSTEPRIADEAGLDTTIRAQRRNMGRARRNGDPFYRFGTSRAPDYASTSDRLPTLNFATASGSRVSLAGLSGQLLIAEQTSPGTRLDIGALSGPHWHDVHKDGRQGACCNPCPIACEAAIRPAGHRGRVRHHPRADRPEYETLAMLGSNLGLESADDVMDGNDACNRLGVDTISGGAALSLICELAARGWLPTGWSEGEVPSTLHKQLIPTDAVHDPDRPLPGFTALRAHGRFAAGDLIPWAFGLPELPPLALERLSTATVGDGSLFGTLAAGAVACARFVECLTGHPATRLTAHSKGLDLPAWDPRGKRGNGLAYMTSNVGASHMRGDYKGVTGLPDRPMLDLVPELIEDQGAKVLRDSWILCAFATPATPHRMQLEAFQALTGARTTWGEAMAAAARQWDQARHWNIAYWDAVSLEPRGEDVLSHRLRRERLIDGPAKGLVSFVDDQDEARSLSAYYAGRGWSEDGRPPVV